MSPDPGTWVLLQWMSYQFFRRAPAEKGGSLPTEIAPYLNYGVLGLMFVGILLGWVWAKPSVERVLQERDAHIASLTAERDRLIAEKQKAEDQRDAAIGLAQDRIVPLLTSFVSTTQTLIPLLQEVVRESDDHRRRG